MASRTARAIVLLVGLIGCGPQVGTGVIDLSATCLKEYPGDIRCCPQGSHVDDGACCPDGSHVVRDFEHADWTICAFDEDPAGVEQDAGPDAP